MFWSITIIHLASRNTIYVLYLDLFQLSILLKQWISSHTVSTEDLELSRIAVWKLLRYIVERVSKMVKAVLRHDVICFQCSSFCSLLNTSPPPLTVRLKKILSSPRIPAEILIRMQSTFSQIKDLQFALLCPVSLRCHYFSRQGVFHMIETLA